MHQIVRKNLQVFRDHKPEPLTIRRRTVPPSGTKIATESTAMERLDLLYGPWSRPVSTL